MSTTATASRRMTTLDHSEVKEVWVTGTFQLQIEDETFSCDCEYPVIRISPEAFERNGWDILKVGEHFSFGNCDWVVINEEKDLVPSSFVDANGRISRLLSWMQKGELMHMMLDAPLLCASTK